MTRVFRRTRQVLASADWLVRGSARKAWLAFREGRLSGSPRQWFSLVRLHWRERTQHQQLGSGPMPMDRAALDDSYARWLESITTRLPGETAGCLDVVAIIERGCDPGPLVRSVRAQPGQWRLYLLWMDEGACAISAPACAEWSEDTRIQCSAVRDRLRADGTWVAPGDSAYLVLVDTTVVLAPGGLQGVEHALERYVDADWIYTDDDRLDAGGSRRDPYLKGEFSPALALSDGFATRLAVVRRRALESVGGLRPDRGEAQIYDLLLRIVGARGRIVHAAQVCCHRRDPTPPALSEVHRSAAEEHVLGTRGTLGLRTAYPGTVAVQVVEWSASVGHADVTFVIPTRDRVDLLEPCVASLRRTVSFDRAALLVIDDHSTEAATLEYLERLRADPAFRATVVRPPGETAPFNYARLMNFGSRLVRTPLMVHLNNDVEGIEPGWVEQMAGWFTFPDVGVVGARLHYPDASLQHAGVIVDAPQGVVEHLQSRLALNDAGYQWLPYKARDVSAVTGACLMTRTDLFAQLGGFDERHLAVQFNDVDFCLRARATGVRVIYEPGAALWHRTSASRGRGYDARETGFLFSKYRGYHEPYMSSQLDLMSACGPTPLVAGCRTDDDKPLVPLDDPKGAPPVGRVQFGDLRRVRPLAANFGLERGVPIDRHYIEAFLEQHRGDIRGRVLEFGDSTYTSRFGGTHVERIDVLHRHTGSSGATIVADISDAAQIPSDVFDCIICTQTLQFVYDVQGAIRTLYRILKPGGVVLATFPGISRTDDAHWHHSWYWCFTPASAVRLFGDVFGEAGVAVTSRGNVLTSISFLHGLVVDELAAHELAVDDPAFPFLLTVRAQRAVAG